MKTVTLYTTKISVHKLNSLYDAMESKGIKLVVVIK